jgi:hypothetical protein
MTSSAYSHETPQTNPAAPNRAPWMTYARKTDSNHAEIREAFRKLGCRVFDACRVGQGFPDLVVQYGGMTLLVEVKTRTGTLTDAQEGSELMAKVVRDMDDVADAVATLKRWCEGVRRYPFEQPAGKAATWALERC